MATVNAISVALFNAAAGGYSAQIAKDPTSLANAVGLILERDISTDAQFVDHLLANFGVMPAMGVYTEAKRALDNLVYTVGRGQATTIAIDFLKMNEGAANDYGTVALNFALKVNSATQFSAAYPPSATSPNWCLWSRALTQTKWPSTMHSQRSTLALLPT